MKSIVVGLFLLGCGLSCAQADSAVPKCSDARDQDVVQHLSRGEKFDDAIAYLETTNVPYFLSSRKGEAISLRLIRDKGYSTFGPLEIIIRSDDGGGVLSMATAMEMLTIEFDKKGALAKEFCFAYSTGT